jgi:hypothetical protein
MAIFSRHPMLMWSRAEHERKVYLKSIWKERKESVKICTPSCGGATKGIDTSPCPSADRNIARTHTYLRPPYLHIASAENRLRVCLVGLFRCFCKKSKANQMDRLFPMCF